MPGGAGYRGNASGDLGLKRGIEPLIMIVRGADSEGLLASGCSVTLHGADVQWIADEVAAGGFERGSGERFGIAGQKRRESCVGFDAGCA